MNPRVAPIALSLALSGGVPGLIAAFAAPGARGDLGRHHDRPRKRGPGVSCGFAINAAGKIAGQPDLLQIVPGCRLPGPPQMRHPHRARVQLERGA
jgi:hypothetical protein